MKEGWRRLAVGRRKEADGERKKEREVSRSKKGRSSFGSGSLYQGRLRTGRRTVLFQGRKGTEDEQSARERGRRRRRKEGSNYK